MAFCTVADVIEYIPGLDLNSSTDVTTASIQNLIDRRYTEILNASNYRDYTLPGSPSAPLSNTDHLLFQLNVQQPVADLLLRRVTDFDPFLFKSSRVQTNIAKKNFQLFLIGYFDFAFSDVLPYEKLCTAAEVAVYMPGFILRATPANGKGPSTTVLEKWIHSESAIIFSYAQYLSYNTNTLTCTSDQLNVYRHIVITKVASDLVRAKAQIASAALDDHANNLLTEYYTLVQNFLNRDFDHVFI